MTPEQIIKGMQERQRRILKIRGGKPKRKPSDKVIDRIVRPKGMPRYSHRGLAYERYQRKRLGLRPPSNLRSHDEQCANVQITALANCGLGGDVPAHQCPAHQPVLARRAQPGKRVQANAEKRRRGRHIVTYVLPSASLHPANTRKTAL